MAFPSRALSGRAVEKREADDAKVGVILKRGFPGSLLERGAKKTSPKPEAILKYAHHPIAILGGMWEELLQEWQAAGDEPRPPVYILVCKNTRIARVVYEWLAEGPIRWTSHPPTSRAFAIAMAG
jgi:hypothetical protein